MCTKPWLECVGASLEAGDGLSERFSCSKHTCWWCRKRFRSRLELPWPLTPQEPGRWFGFPSEGKQSLCRWISEETRAPGPTPGSPVGLTSAWPDSDVGRPSGMLVSIHLTNSVASSLFSHNCKQTEAAVARQLPSGLKSHQVHLVWITSLPPVSPNLPPDAAFPTPSFQENSAATFNLFSRTRFKSCRINRDKSSNGEKKRHIRESACNNK